jgi:hypothetical protein
MWDQRGRSPATSPPPPACKPAHGPTSSEATEASKTATTASATSTPTRIAAVFEIIPASPPARHQWARLRHQFSSKHTNTRGTTYYDSSICEGGNKSGRFAAMSRNARTKALPTSTLGTSNGHIPSK